jgi:hypothetical protein
MILMMILVSAVKVAAEKLSKKEKEDRGRDSRNNNNRDDKNDRGGGGSVENRDKDIISRRRAAWADDETLGSYIMAPPVKKDRLDSMVQSMKMMEMKGGIMETNGSGGDGRRGAI